MSGKPISTDCMRINMETGQVCALADGHSGRHSWEGPEPVCMKAAIGGVRRSTKKGVEIEVLFGTIDVDQVARLLRLVGDVVQLTIQPEAEQQKLPLD